MNQTSTEADQSPVSTAGWLRPAHFYVWLTAGAVFYFGDELDRVYGLWLLMIPLLGVPALIAMGTFIVGLIASLWYRLWGRLLSVMGAPALTIGLLVAFAHYEINPDWIRFQLTSGHYAELARNLPGPSPKYGKWDWGETGGATGPNFFYNLVYDETDKPLDRPEMAEQKGWTYSVHPYGRHFFLITALYQ
ncbi:hypothetical protein [Pseudomonas edaphica]|uniref:hypothetical protein n=1 Tax=Pseudomonas edaphica TaxID=2006980 RepID=UPI003D0C21C1